jgi:hypothetical protein
MSVERGTPRPTTSSRAIPARNKRGTEARGAQKPRFALIPLGYVLRAGALGGVGGQVSSRAVCAAFGGAAQTGSTIYVPCSNGLRMVQISSGGSIRLGWQTRSGATGPPVIGGGDVAVLVLGPLNLPLVPFLLAGWLATGLAVRIAGVPGQSETKPAAR